LLDIIQLPQRSDFATTESYFSTALHELGHYAAFRIMPRG
jgi:antirestriction protein ArdC